MDPSLRALVSSPGDGSQPKRVSFPSLLPNTVFLSPFGLLRGFGVFKLYFALFYLFEYILHVEYRSWVR